MQEEAQGLEYASGEVKGTMVISVSKMLTNICLTVASDISANHTISVPLLRTREGNISAFSSFSFPD